MAGPKSEEELTKCGVCHSPGRTGPSPKSSVARTSRILCRRAHPSLDPFEGLLARFKQSAAIAERPESCLEEPLAAILVELSLKAAEDGDKALLAVEYEESFLVTAFRGNAHGTQHHRHRRKFAPLGVPPTGPSLVSGAQPARTRNVPLLRGRVHHQFRRADHPDFLYRRNLK